MRLRMHSAEASARGDSNEPSREINPVKVRGLSPVVEALGDGGAYDTNAVKRNVTDARQNQV